MLQTAKVIMTATLKASDKGLELIDKARCKKGWNKTEQAWADIAWTSPGTLRRFWKGIAIQSNIFKAICKAVDEDWEKVYDEGLPSNDDVPITSKRLAFAIAGSIDEVDKSKLDAITALLRKLGGDASIEIVNIEEGSIKLTLSGSLESLERIESLFMSGELAEILGSSVQDVHFIDADELSESIRENGGNSLNLHKVNLIGANLSEADLSGAILSEAILSEAILSEADLIGAILIGAILIKADLNGANLNGANLIGAILIRADLNGANLSSADLRGANLIRADLNGANLIGAYLSSADLSGAYLIRADLNGANLSGANLNGANLSGANLIRANLRGADLRGANLSEAIVTDAAFTRSAGISEVSKQDLIRRGAIFDDELRKRSSTYSPVPSGRR